MLSPEDQAALSTFAHARGRMPQTPERAELDRRRSIREVVFGSQDGVLMALAVITGMSAATSQHIALFSMVIETVGGAISMGMGQFLGAGAEADVIAATVAREAAHLAADPEAEFRETVDFWVTKGFADEQARGIARTLTQNPEVWQAEMLRDEYGIEHAEASNAKAIRDGVVMAGAFCLGAGLPTLACFLFPHSLVVPVSVAMTLLGGVGAFAGQISQGNVILSALKLIISGAILAGFTYLAGTLIAVN